MSPGFALARACHIGSFRFGWKWSAKKNFVLRYDTSRLHGMAIDKEPVMQVDEVHNRKD